MSRIFIMLRGKFIFVMTTFIINISFCLNQQDTLDDQTWDLKSALRKWDR